MVTHQVLKKKHDGALYTQHGMELWEETEEGLWGLNPIGDIWSKPQSGTNFKQDHYTVLYFPKDKWYNLLYYFDLNNNNVESVYINLATPYRMEGHQITYVDYDIDLILRDGRQLVIDDVDEWQARKGLYPSDIVTEIERTMNELIRQILGNEFPLLPQIRKIYQDFVINLK